MTTLTAKYFIGSRIARRTLLLFMVCALLPILVLAIQNHRRVDSLFQEQMADELKRSAKGVGLMLFERFQYLDRQMDDLVERMADGRVSDKDGLLWSQPSSMFEEVRLTGFSEEEIRTLVGYPVDTWTLSSLLMKGNEANVISAGQYPDASIWLFKKTGNEHAGSLLAARVKKGYLWQELDEYDYGKLFNITTAGGRSLYATVSSTVDSSLLKKNPQVEWDMFLGNIRLPENWKVVATIINPAMVNNDQESFEQYTFITSLLALLLAALIGTYSIRKSTEPLEALQEGIEHIRQNDFSHQVSIQSNDEFELLGNAFNTMTGKLDQHINAIRSLSAIDQLILGPLKIEDIIKVVLKEGIHLLQAENLYLFLKMDRSDGFYAYASADPRVETVTLSGQALEKLDRPGQLIAWHDTGLEAAVVPGRDENRLVYTSHLNANGELKAVMLAEFRADLGDDVVTIAALFADHVGFALSNANWEARLYKQAHYDSLTGLPNRYSFNAQLAVSINQAARSKQFFAVLFVDIDDFKLINEAMGQEAGDEFLAEFAARMKGVIREEGFLSRLGGDEFALIYYCNDQSRSQMNNRIGELVENLRRAANKALVLEGRELISSVSIGISMFPHDTEKAAELLKYADEAKRRAKEAGKNRVYYFSDIDNYSNVSRLDFMNELRAALDNNELELYYQPKVRADNGRLDGCEALIRWNHPVRGLLSPYYFIPQAEEYGMIEDIGRWVIKTAAAQQVRWLQDGVHVGRVAVNVSVLQLLNKDFCGEFIALLEETGCPGHALEVEITETAYVEDMEHFRKHMENLSREGLAFSVDDYGTGYSSLSMLLNLPVAQFKIDKSFIDEIEKSKMSFAIVETTIMLAKKVGFKVVAEGVESAGQFRLLQSLGCDTIQGYFFSKPVPAADIPGMTAPDYFLPSIKETIPIPVATNTPYLRAVNNTRGLPQ